MPGFSTGLRPPRRFVCSLVVCNGQIAPFFKAFTVVIFPGIVLWAYSKITTTQLGFHSKVRKDYKEDAMPVYLKRAQPRPAEDLSQVRETVRQIIEKVKQEGEDAVPV